MQHFKEESIGFGDCLHMRKAKKGLSSKRREEKHIRFAFCWVNRFYSVTTDNGGRRLGMELSSSPACAEETGPFKGNWRQGEAGLREGQGGGGAGRAAPCKCASAAPAQLQVTILSSLRDWETEAPPSQ